MLFPGPRTEHERVLERNAVLEDQPRQLEQQLGAAAVIIRTGCSCCRRRPLHAPRVVVRADDDNGFGLHFTHHRGDHVWAVIILFDLNPRRCQHYSHVSRNERTDYAAVAAVAGCFLKKHLKKHLNEQKRKQATVHSRRTREELHRTTHRRVSHKDQPHAGAGSGDSLTWNVSFTAVKPYLVNSFAIQSAAFNPSG